MKDRYVQVHIPFTRVYYLFLLHKLTYVSTKREIYMLKREGPTHGWFVHWGGVTRGGVRMREKETRRDASGPGRRGGVVCCVVYISIDRRLDGIICMYVYVCVYVCVIGFFCRLELEWID